METRKIISFGNSSYVISIPKAWIVENKLKKGDTIHLEDKKDEISIFAHPNGRKPESKETVIDIDNKEMGLVTTQIVSAYLNGYNIIHIKGDELEKKSQQVKTILRNLTGMEIIQQTSNKITSKDLLNIKEISIPTLVRRMDNIIRAMILDSIATINEDHYDSVYERDQDVNRLTFLGFRVIKSAFKDSSLTKHFAMDYNELLLNWVVITKLEKIGDKTKRIARELNKINTKKAISEEEKNKLKELYNAMYKDFTEAMKAFYKNDIELAFQMEVRNKERIRLCNEYFPKGSCELCKEYKDKNCVYASKVVEYLKGMSTGIKNIARAVIGVE